LQIPVEKGRNLSFNILIFMSSSKNMYKLEKGFIVFESLLVMVLLGLLMEGVLSFYQRYENALWALVPQ
jgi:hypothetical protein